MRIERIEIQHFRGFPAHYEFKLGKGGKNLLVYGENGSGKSSLFRALKGFFEALPTSNLAGQQNRFVSTPEPSVKLEVAAYSEAGDRLPGSSVYEWSASSFPGSVALIHAANKTKGCLDYKALLETHYVHRDKDEIEIFDLLINTVLGDVENPISRKLLRQEFKDLVADKKNHMGYGYKETYQSRISQFNEGLTAVLGLLAVSGNSLLSEFFPDTKLALVIGQTLVFSGVAHNKRLAIPTVKLTIEFAGRPMPQAHEFLNEARLSAVAIALYLGTLLMVPQSQLRVLILDDLLIGIDMSNRFAVLNVLLKRFPTWQIILLTHDRVWYDTVRMRTLDEKTWWYASLFAETSTDLVPTPLWRGNDEGWNSNLARAKVHLANHDDRAAGVYARSAFEGKLKKYCEDKKVAVQYQSNQSKMTTEMFWLGIKNKLGVDGKLADVQTQISGIEAYRKVVLNPLSHENPTTLTEIEVQGAITAIEELDKVLK